MAGEIQVSAGLTIRQLDASGNILLQYTSLPAAFLADMTGAKGPVPGAFTAATTGTDVDLSELTTPGVCIIKNFDDTNYVTYGMWDPESNLFYPLGEVQPGEAWPLRLSRFISQEYGTGTGTGTAGPSTNKLRIIANAAACNVSVEAFEA